MRFPRALHRVEPLPLLYNCLKYFDVFGEGKQVFSYLHPNKTRILFGQPA